MLMTFELRSEICLIRVHNEGIVFERPLKAVPVNCYDYNNRIKYNK